MTTFRLSTFALAGAIVAGTAAFVTPAAAQDYPADDITIVVPRAPGGGSDNIIRILQEPLSEKLGVPVVIDNRPDPSAVVGTELVSRAEPDGYTLYLSDNAFYQNPAIIKDLPYDPVNDFVGVTRLARSPVVLVIHPDVPAKNTRELVEYAKANPGQLTFSHGGIGASTHLAGIQFNIAAGTDITPVAYASSGPALNAVLGGHVQMHMGGISSSGPQIEAGGVRAIGLTGSKEHPALPGVPTLEADGLPGVTITSVWGILAPAGTPLEVRTVVADAVREVMNMPDVAEKLSNAGYQPVASTPEEHDAEAKEMIDYWLNVAKETDLSQ
ncbi:tripartite tricarboxylate transporter family receptor (plasmid) [Antarctobacter heliothermus]|uniref:Tripartite tricarboxylate transporter family receptor n=1 Tax=Antarctobacter heliothermus TaxID=74033 RepID=A0A222EC76_9RHOB|nr:tripartite tricarboxylate transporter substrate-binding protein [Antarctobacter heliothermus]ASP23668.1 tripartite tricarboxylate transporter family receptor [Antarctobacter heliothermus]